MLSSGLAVLSATGAGAGVAVVSPFDAVLASIEAELSGTGDGCTGTAAGAGSMSGALALTGASGALTVVSPVNGFLYSLTGFITSKDVGL